MAKAKTAYVCTDCGAEHSQVARPVRRVRRLEHAFASSSSSGRRPQPSNRARQLRRQHATRRRSRSSLTVAAEAELRARDRHRRARSRARRRAGRRLGRADRRRSGHRQVDAAAADARRARAARCTGCMSPARNRSRRSPSRATAARHCARAAAKRWRKRAIERILERSGEQQDRACWSSIRSRRSGPSSSPRHRVRSARCANRPRGWCASPRKPAPASSSSVTSPRKAASPVRACSSTWSTRCCTSKANRVAAFACCARSRTASARSTSSACSR